LLSCTVYVCMLVRWMTQVVIMYCVCMYVGQVDDPGCSATSSEEAELREQLITKHYSRRIAELTSQLQLADGKALHFFAEVLPILNCAIPQYLYNFPPLILDLVINNTFTALFRYQERHQVCKNFHCISQTKDIFSRQWFDTVGWATGMASSPYKAGCWDNLPEALYVL